MISQHAWFVDLNGVDEILRVRLQLPFALFQLVRARSHHAARTNGCFRDITKEQSASAMLAWVRDVCLPAGNSKQIAWDWNRLMESVQLVARLGGKRRLANGQTTGHDR